MKILIKISLLILAFCLWDYLKLQFFNVCLEKILVFIFFRRNINKNEYFLEKKIVFLCFSTIEFLTLEHKKFPMYREHNKELTITVKSSMEKL